MDDNILKLASPSGEVVEFVEIATIFINHSKYLIVQPVKPIEGMAEDEALVYKVIMVGKNKAKYDLILDDDILDKVFIEYNKLLDEVEGEK